MRMYLTIISVAFLLGTWPFQVGSNFYIEYTTNKHQRSYGPDLKTFLFDCAVDPDGYHAEGMKPPIFCALVDSSSQREKIYSTQNFFIVRGAKLPPDQSISFIDVVGKSVPDRLYLAITHEQPIDYPDFLPHDEEVGKEKTDKEDEKMSTSNSNMDAHLSIFLSITNLKVFWEDSDRFILAFKAYMKKLGKMVDNNWRKLFDHTFCLSSEQKLIKQTEEKYQQDPTPIPVETETAVSELLTKMIDPCFIKTLANSGRKSDRISEVSHRYCKICCRSLALYPLLVKRSVAPQCQDLASGECVEGKCMCSKQLPKWPFVLDPKWKSTLASITMSECSNRVITVASSNTIQRFPDQLSGLEQIKSAPVSDKVINVPWGWEMVPLKQRPPRKKLLSTRQRWEIARNRRYEEQAEGDRQVKWTENKYI